MKKLLLFALQLALVASCAEQGVSEECEVIKVDMQSDVRPDVEIVNKIELESSAESLLGSGRLVVTPKYFLYLSYGEGVAVFTRDGKFVSKFNPTGRSRREITSSRIDCAKCDGDTITLVDSYRRRVLKYTLDGKYIGEREELADIAGVFEESSSIVVSALTVVGEGDPLVYAYDKSSGRVAEMFEPIHSKYIETDIFMDDDQIYYSPAFDLTIYAIDNKTMEAKPRYEVDLGGIWMSESRVKSVDGEDVQDLFDLGRKTNKIFWSDFDKSGKWLTIRWRWDGALYTCFYDTLNGSQYLTKIDGQDISDLELLALFECADDDGFYVALPADEYVKMYGEDQGVAEGDNPVIVHMRIRD